MKVLYLVAGAVIAVAIAAAGGVAYVMTTGLSAKAEPMAIEASVAARVKRLAIPSSDARRTNPVAPGPDVLAEGLGHYADHCASCHAIDGSGKTELGRGLFPKAPDMRGPGTQTLSDGELFYIIEHGIRFTGMPGWSTGTEAGTTSSWHLVHAIRHLPTLTAEERSRMEELVPRSPEVIRQEIEEEKFLNGDGDGPPPSSTAH